MPDDLIFHDSQGAPICYLDAGENVYTFSGEPVAYVMGKQVYTFAGRFLGWLEHGWLSDRENRPLFYSEEAVGGPSKPARKMHPMRSARKLRPIKGLRERIPLRPMRKSGWSGLNLEGWLAQ